MTPEELLAKKNKPEDFTDMQAEGVLRQCVQRLQAANLPYVIITKMPAGGMQWALSERAYARGACARLETMLDELERCEVRDEKPDA